MTEKQKDAIDALIAWDDYGGDAPEMLSDAIEWIREAFDKPKTIREPI